MIARIAQWTLDVDDVPRMVRFWSAALGYQRTETGEDGSVHLYPPADAGPDAVRVWLQATHEPKQGKNRGHPDLVADGDPEAEADRLVALGARRIDIVQPADAGFIVLADPEGNEFCVLR